MTKDDIIRMAEECGIPEFRNDESQADDILRFAALVAAAERERIIAKNAPVIEQINGYVKALEEAALKERNHEHEEPLVKTYSGGKPNYTQRFTLSCGCPSQYGGVPAYWDKDDSTAFGMICEKHWYEYGARSEA